MVSVDTNILLYAYVTKAPEYSASLRFLESLAVREDVVISELALIEFYRLLRNPAVLAHPLSASEAVEVIQAYRLHPYWRLVGFPSNSRRVHDRLWQVAEKDGFAYRRIFDARLALTLIEQGVTDFATVNVKHFLGLGFQRVWDPLAKA